MMFFRFSIVREAVPARGQFFVLLENSTVDNYFISR